MSSFRLFFGATKAPSELQETQDIYFFKEGIHPSWEDPVNALGGKWQVVVSTSEIERIEESQADEYWERLLTALVAGEFRDSGEICGAALSVKKKLRKISLWLRHGDASYEELIVSIGVQLKNILGMPESFPLYFIVHDREKLASLPALSVWTEGQTVDSSEMMMNKIDDKPKPSPASRPGKPSNRLGADALAGRTRQARERLFRAAS
eukprot:CAMPEP_0184490108 /NCGR_PEP_ID=MMETSP0113_2-20130426/17174_1 /TAXON_ID=91329 /ORGANISM="Norrisiella sphaerica, Strain BC52" /LENGTH=207 /DNA_ID=CAMNT_0026873865 /DNA_START=778 /DNA_END=1401 /DNA_ORIENTATION=+